MGVRESATSHLDASPEAVFNVVTDLARLPAWNDGITEIVELPERLEPGAVWKVRIHALGQSWVSKSTATVVEPATGRFAYRSESDDGNPSFADWEWRITPDGGGCTVTVTFDINPRTFWRKHLFVKIRRSGLRREIHGSLAALAAASAQ